jgi:hypothetical protein
MTAGQGVRKFDERGRRGKLFRRPLADACDGPVWVEPPHAVAGH